MQFPKGHFVFLDVETTGGRATQDRIIEVGLVEVLDGEVIDQFQTLVNPESAISQFITSLTGIDDSLVDQAPVFSDIAEGLLSRLSGKILVAHNARFDHSFLKNEFRRAGYDYRTKLLCTVKLSRALMPNMKSHRLDRLIDVHGLMIESRHRALDDAEVLVQLMNRWAKTNDLKLLNNLIRKQLKSASLPPQLPRKMIDALPLSPGVYLFYDDKEALLYTGKSVNIRERVKSHFTNDHSSDKELAISQQVARIDFQLTGGDLGAQLLESKIIKEQQPVYNQQLRKTKLLWYFLLEQDSHGYKTLNLTSGANLSLDDIPNTIGLFRSKKMAESVLQKVVKENQLCHRLTGIEKGRKGSCFTHQLKQCLGACTGKEEVEVYNERFEDAIHPWRFKQWPYESAIVVEESCNSKSQYHLIDRWCHLGSSDYLSDLIALYETEKNKLLQFEYDTYKLLLKHLQKNNGELLVLSINNISDRPELEASPLYSIGA